MKSTATTEVVVFTSGRKWVLEHKMVSKHLLGRAKTEGGLEK
jgi:hypothetical protein